MNPEVDALKHFYAAVNRNDMDAMVRDWDPQIVRTEPEGFETAGTYRGIGKVQANVGKGRGTWADTRWHPECRAVRWCRRPHRTSGRLSEKRE